MMKTHDPLADLTAEAYRYLRRAREGGAPEWAREAYLDACIERAAKILATVSSDTEGE